MTSIGETHLPRCQLEGEADVSERDEAKLDNPIQEDFGFKLFPFVKFMIDKFES